MQPYQFGYCVGAATEKRALNGLGEAVMGTGSTMGQLNPMGDPTQRGILADAALYSNPFTGVPTAINDVGRHLYNGRWMDAGMSGLSGALSFIPGWGFAAKGVGKAVAQGGKSLARAGFTNTGNAIARGSQQFLTKGTQAVNSANRAVSGAIQRGLPLAQKPGMAGKLYNTAIQNPLQAAPIALPLAGAAGSVGMALAGGGGGGQQQQQFQPSGPGVYGGGQAHTPLASF